MSSVLFGGDSVTFGGDVATFGGPEDTTTPQQAAPAPIGLRVLAGNAITTVLADTVNANFPASNMLDEHPKRKYKADAGDYQATLVVQVKSINCLALFGTNAQSCRVTISDPNAIAWQQGTAWEEGTAWANIEITAPVVNLAQQSESFALWVDMEPIDAPVAVSLLLVAPIGQTIEVGVLRAGVALFFPCPQYGIREGLIDYSIRQEMANGSWYYKRRDIVRQFTGDLLTTRDADFYRFLYQVIRANGSTPLAWRLIGSSDNWVVFARPEMPQGEHQAANRQVISFQLTEVI